MKDHHAMSGSSGSVHPPQRVGRLNRREALRHLSAGALLTLGLWPGGQSAASAPGGTFRFVVVNDTHYMSPECGAWLETVVQQMKTHPGIEFCLMAGDLTQDGDAEAMGATREILGGLGRPVYVVIGNHDYESPDSRGHYERVFPGTLNYHFEHRQWQFVGLDTSEGQKYQQTTIQPSTLRWVDDHLHRLDRRKPTVLFTHFPLGAGVTYRPLNADHLLGRFLDYNVRAVFSGHFHGFTERRHGRMTFTTNRCCALKRGNHDGTPEKGYFVCTADQTGIRREFFTVPTPPPDKAG